MLQGDRHKGIKYRDSVSKIRQQFLLRNREIMLAYFIDW